MNIAAGLMESCIIFFVIILHCIMVFAAEVDPVDLTNTATWETRGWYKRELSLIKPYQGSGADIPFWDSVGSTMITPNYIRLTPDVQSKQGGVWCQYPVFTRDWEMHVSYRVHGSKGQMFGDGMAIWYVKQKDRNQLGPVFGGKDMFTGLGVYLDTYSNHNGVHSHDHPYISAMVNNGTVAYDHDRDGTHTQLGGEHTGCEAKFRNHDWDAQILIRYVADTLSVYTDHNNKGVWDKCFSVPGVRLPTGYSFGISAATGELSDNHDVISVRFYEADYQRAETEANADRENIDPSAEFQAAPRDHISDPKPSNLGWFGTIVLVIVAIVVCIGALGFGITFIQNRQERSRKRFY